MFLFVLFDSSMRFSVDIKGRRRSVLIQLIDFCFWWSSIKLYYLSVFCWIFNCAQYTELFLGPVCEAVIFQLYVQVFFHWEYLLPIIVFCNIAKYFVELQIEYFVSYFKHPYWIAMTISCDLESKTFASNCHRFILAQEILNASVRISRNGPVSPYPSSIE